MVKRIRVKSQTVKNATEGSTSNGQKVRYSGKIHLNFFGLFEPFFLFIKTSSHSARPLACPSLRAWPPSLS